MKLNGKKNIITDRDVTITGDKNLGDSLHSVIAKHQTDLDKLKSNVKWLFKYGGVGSGTGGGSAPGKWSVVATLDGKTISNNNKISLNQDISSYVLDIRISGASTSYYVEYSYGNISRSISLSADNGWRFKQNIDLTSNGHITITVSDGSLIKTVEADYITAPYILSEKILLLKNNGDEWPSTSGDIFMKTAVVEGLILGCSYSFAITAEVKYLWEFNGEIIEGKIDNLSGSITFPVDPNLLEDPMNAGLYSSTLKFFITPEGQTEIIETVERSFNLIPNDLFLKILPAGSGEQIYDSEQPENSNFYQYSINKNIGFYCRAYKGSNNGSPCDISYKTLGSSGEETSGELAGKEGQTYLINMRFETPGWHKLMFTCTMESETKHFIKYLYCFQSASNYTWYKLINNKLASSKGNISYSNYYRVTSANKSDNFAMTAPVIMTANSQSHIINIPEPSALGDIGEFAINIGIQYNNINNVKNPIFNMSTLEARDSIRIFQNSVELKDPFVSDAKQAWFIPKTLNYDTGIPENYHLLSFVLTNARYDDNDNLPYYQCCLYIDGIIEGAFKLFMNGSNWINEVELCPGNYTINLLDITYFESSDKNISSINDVDINYYYKTYYSVNNNTPIDAEASDILNCFYNNSSGGSTYSLYNNLIRVEGTLYDNVASNTKIPTLVLKRDMLLTEIEGGGSVIDWLNASYSQDESTGPSKWKIPVQVKWGKGLTTTTEVVMDKSFGDNTSFYIELQGSSTLSNKSKNLTLGIETDSALGSTVVFSPNYNADDNKTFLPEQMFTLKADVVDSSHSNNTAIGAFINNNNDCNDAFSDAQPDGVKEEIRNHVKQCLEGFPVLLYLELTDSTGEKSPEYYYLGVYNFNLGRESYFNLGYCDLTQLNNIENASDTFMFTTVKSLDPLDKFIAAEIQGNNKFWDFSQYDESILFPLPNESSGFMFGDFVRNSNNVTYQNSIKDFVKSVARCGGYLFNSIGKTFEDVNQDSSDRYCYHEVNAVPDVKTQYIRVSTESGHSYEKNPNVESFEITSETNLTNCITTTNDGGTLIPPYLDYKSAVYYYTTCMVFGLVDSVQKNLNIKTWNGKTFGAYFYDMDTSLGTSNSGGDTSYFCFSDYWDNKTEEVKDDNDNVLETILKGISINRDYYPLQHSGIIGYDVPSSYLFAISKYVSSVSSDASLKAISPQQIYATWRQTGGILENANKFINTYYASTLKDVPAELLNLNYRNKFLYNLAGTSFSNEQSGLSGTKIEKTRSWLNGRLHILDAYFNLGNITTRLSDNPNITFIEPKHTVNLSTNKDIYILKDIFVSPTETRDWTRENTCSFKVTGEEYSPLIVTRGETTNRYLLVNPDVVYTINERFSGQQIANFGGSDLWTSLETINPFIDTLTNKENFYLNSEKISRIYADSNLPMVNWEFITPSATDIILTGKNYSGSLKINSSFYNLTNLDISNSKISLEVDGAKVTSVNLNNVNSQNVILRNCNDLQNVNLSNAVITKVDIRPAWIQNIDLSNNKITNLTIQGKQVDGEYGELTIKNASYLNSLTFSGFKKVYITDAVNLSTVECNDSINTILEEVVINNSSKLSSLTLPVESLHTLNLEKCNNLSKIKLKGNNYDSLVKLNLIGTKVTKIEFDSDNKEYLDLSRFTNLGASADSSKTYIKLAKNPDVEYIQFKNVSTPVYLSYPINECTNLKRVYGNISLNCTSCFYQNYKFSIHGSDLTEVVWQNSSVLNNGRVLMPYEILGENVNISKDLLQQSGDEVTNISLNGTSAASDFSYTNCTIFDYYYFFTVCRNVKNCDSTFAWTQNLDWGIFNWTETVDNSPNRNMFALSTNITSLANCFRQSITTETPKIRIFTPTERESISTDGLFSSLKLMTELSYIFLGYRIYTDRFIFRLPSDNFSLTTLAGLSIYLFVDNVNDINYSDLEFNINNSNTLLNSGNISNIFNNLNNVKSLYAFPNTTYIDYRTSSFVLPSSLQILGSSFVSTYAQGEIKLQDYAVNCKDKLRIINSSFRVTNELVIGGSYKAIFYLNNNTFAGLKSIEVIGFGNPGNSNYDTTPSSYTASSFNGAGINKIIDETNFPYNIFINTQSKNIKQLSGIFMNAIPKIAYSKVELPNNMFTNLSKLEQTTAMFYNLNQEYYLSNSNNFINFAHCTSLTDVSYMFGQDSYDGDVQRTPRLVGSIPKRFFYHGGVNKVVTGYSGADNVTYSYDENGEVIEIITENEQSVPGFTYEQPYSTISNMAYCFARCNCDAYINSDIDNDLEPNPNYSPKNWIYNSITETWTKNSKVDKNLQTAIWTYDGYNKPTLDCEQLDSIGIDSGEYNAGIVKYGEGADSATPTLYYLAPPDLLRYCTSNANITGLFAYSGVRGWDSRWNNAGVHKYTYGLKGRICPYMLKPVSDTNNLDYLFASCKCLSYYEEFNGNAYFIPSDFFSYANKITSLVGTFTDTLLPGNIYINVFDKLLLPLNITDLFYQCYWNGSEDSRVIIDSVFKTSQILATKRSFCIVIDATSQANRVRKQYITFNNVFNSKYAGEIYANNMNYSLTFAGYANSTVQHETNKTLPDNTTTNNYLVANE